MNARDHMNVPPHIHVVPYCNKFSWNLITVFLLLAPFHMILHQTGEKSCLLKPDIL